MNTKTATSVSLSSVHVRVLAWVAALITALMAVSTSHAQSSEARALLSHDGLQEMKSKDLDMLYVQPGATLAAYTKVWLEPVEVAFHRSWNPDRRSVNAKDRERIRSEMAKGFHEVFTQELQAGDGYQVVSAPGPDVLRVSAAIINLYITAPDTMQPGRTQTYTVSSGEMTLVAELRDSESGAILARVADRKVGRSSGMLLWTTRASNAADARRVLRSWAQVLRKGLDSARANNT